MLGIRLGRRSEPGLRIKSYDPTRPLAFLHVPKTAGAALGAGLARSLGAKRALSGFDRVLFGGFEDFSSVAADERRHVYREIRDMPTGADYVAGHFSASTFSAAYPRRNTWS